MVSLWIDSSLSTPHSYPTSRYVNVSPIFIVSALANSFSPGRPGKWWALIGWVTGSMQKKSCCGGV